MKNKIIIGGIALGIILLGLGIQRLFISMKEPPPQEKVYVQERYVPVSKVVYEEHSAAVTALGRLRSRDRIEIFSEVNGALEASQPGFETGNFVSKGRIIAKIDDRETRFQLYSQKSDFLSLLTKILPDLKLDFPNSFSEWNTYLEQFDIEEPLAEIPDYKSAKEKYYLASRSVFKVYYGIKAMELRLSKHEISAPFDGIISESYVRVGTLVRQGQKMGDFTGSGIYELESSVPAVDVAQISVGNPAVLSANETNGLWQGRVTRLGNTIDLATQTVKIFITVSGAGLRDGMYVKAEITGKPLDESFKIPRKALIDNEFVYIAKEETLELVKVNVLRIGENEAYINGLNPGTEVVVAPVAGAYGGMKIITVDSDTMKDNNE